MRCPASAGGTKVVLLRPKSRDQEAASHVRPPASSCGWAGAAEQPENANKTQAGKGQNSVQTQETGLRITQVAF